MRDSSGLPSSRAQPVTLTGDVAPDFKVLTSLGEFVSLKDYAGKRVIPNGVPSLATAVCCTLGVRLNKAPSSAPRGPLVPTEGPAGRSLWGRSRGGIWEARCLDIHN